MILSLVSLDYKIFETINSYAWKSLWLDFLGVFCAKYLIFIMIVIFFVWWLEIKRTKSSENWPILGKRKWLEFGSVFLSVTSSIILSQLLSLVHFRPRPFISYSNVENMVSTFSSKSFPSDHAAFTFALAIAIFFYNKKLGSVLLIAALLVGLGRIYTGVHYPLDVLAGAMVGVLSAIIMLLLFRKLDGKHK